MKTYKIIGIALMALLSITGCKKRSYVPEVNEGSSNTTEVQKFSYQGEGKMQVSLTDGPSRVETDPKFEGVFIDVQQVLIHYEGKGSDEWLQLRTNVGVYNLVTLRDNFSTAVIASHERLPLGTINQIKLVLGKNNSVIKDGLKYGLIMPYTKSGGWEINVSETIKLDNFLSVVLDFDAETSVQLNGNGEYMISPVISIKEPINN